MRRFLKALKFGCMLLAIALASPPAHGQLNNSELRDEYERQMKLLPPLSVTTEFSSQITEDEFKSRFEADSEARAKKLSDLTVEQREQFREHLKLPPGVNALQKFFDDQDNASFIGAQDKHRTSGRFEFFGGNLKEIRSYSPDDELMRTLQFGAQQPKLRR